MNIFSYSIDVDQGNEHHLHQLETHLLNLMRKNGIDWMNKSTRLHRVNPDTQKAHGV